MSDEKIAVGSIIQYEFVIYGDYQNPLKSYLSISIDDTGDISELFIVKGNNDYPELIIK